MTARINAQLPADLSDALATSSAALTTPPDGGALQQICRDWLFEKALPRWLTEGFDRETGLFKEALPFTQDDTGYDRNQPIRGRVQPRQLHVMARARQAGLRHPELDDVLLQGFAVLHDNIHRRKPAQGWVHLLASDGTVLDGRSELYDQAFVLLACASLHATFQDSHFLETARVTLALMDEQMRHPAGGYIEFIDENGAAGNDPVRWQNPCMHLLEAGLALSQCGADAALRKRALDLAAEMTGLFSDYFFNPQSDFLGEVFDSDWQAIKPPEQNYFEPGHHFEWVFLLNEFQRCGGHVPEKTDSSSVLEMSQRLMRVGLENGLDQPLTQAANQTARFALDRVTHDFTRLDGRRLWPQTEWLRALMIYGEDKAAAVLLQNLFDTYLQPPQADRDGLWMDSYTQNGVPTAYQVPASTLYHLWGALAFYAGLEK